MNTKINVAAILKDASQGTKLYSPLCGDCWLITADYSGDGFGKDFPIIVSRDKDGKINTLRTLSFTAQGTFLEGVGECMLFPSKEMRDWEKYPKHEFKPFDKVLVRDNEKETWKAELYNYYIEEEPYPFRCIGRNYKDCIPYEGNEHLLGTTNSPKEGGEK